MKLAGKVAVVTGASSGIGEATAQALAARGMTVVAVARRAERLDRLAARDARIRAFPADVTEEEDVIRLAAWVESELGACHVLVNNAGTSERHRLHPDDRAVIDRILDVNLWGPIRCMTAFADLLFASAPARVVNVASLAGKVGVGPPAYAASKFALVGLSEAAGPDWERRGVTVSQLNPGFVSTERFPQERLLRSAGRWLVSPPDRVAEAVVALARSGSRERTVPRWYRLAVVARHVVAPLFWAAVRRRR